MLSYALVFIDESGISVTLKSISHSLAVNHHELYWIVNSYLVTFSALLLLGGKLSDQYGAKRVFQLGVIIFLVSSILCALAPNLLILLIGRACQGVGASFILPSIPTLIHSHTHRDMFSKIFGVVLSGANVFYAIGPIIGGTLCFQLGWRYFFWINIPIALLILFFANQGLTNFPNKNEKFSDFQGLFLFALSIASLIIVLMEGNQWHWLGIKSTACYFIFVTLFSIFIWHEQHGFAPMINLQFFRDPLLAAACMVLLISTMALTLIIYWGVWLQFAFKMDAQTAGVALLPTTFTLMIVPALQGIWVSKRGTRTPLLTGLACMVLGLLWVLRFSRAGSYFHIIPGFILFGIGIPLAIPSAIMSIMMSVSEEFKGIASGIYTTVRQLGLTMGAAVLSAIISTAAISNQENYTHLLNIGMVFMLVITILATIITLIFIPSHGK